MANPASSAPRSADAVGAETPGAAPTTAAPARSACEIIAVTTSDEFLLELGSLLGGQASTRPVESLDAALEHLGNSRRTQLIAFDIRGVADVHAALARAHARAPELVIVAFADEEESARALREGSSVHSVLPIPVDAAKTGAALEAAMAAAEKRRATRTGQSRTLAAAAAAAPASAPASTADPPPEEPARLSWLPGVPPLALAAGGAALLLALGAGAWFMLRADETPRGTVQVTPAAPEEPAEVDVLPAAPAADVLVGGTLDELLEKARLAMRQRRFTEPAGDNALVYYRSALALDGSNAEAADGLTRIGGLLVSRIEEALAANRGDEAGAALAAAKGAIGGDPRLPPLERQLYETQFAAAMADGQFDRATGIARAAQKSDAMPAERIAQWRADVARRQGESRIKAATDRVAERLRDGRLLEPADDSAKHHLQQLREIAPTGAATQRLAKDFTAALLRKARESQAAGRASEAERWLGEARASGATPAEITAVQREITATRQRAVNVEGDRLAQLARERLKAGRLTEPENDSAAHHLAALREHEAAHTAVAPISRELATKLIDRASVAAREGRGAQMEADLTAARRWGAEPKELDAVRDLAAKERARAREAQVANLQRELKRKRYVAPEYPPRALEKGESGSVTVEFVVGVEGDIRDARVTASEPEGVFDRAALAAVRRWRYEPLVVDGVPVEIPTRAIIKFEAPKE